MAIFPTQKQQQEQALRENLYVANWCLDFNKKTSLDFNDTKNGCLGYPAFILLASIIDTMGSFFRNTEAIINVESQPRFIETASDHFLILNHEKLFNLKLKGVTIYDFYSSYRSKMTHNNSLPQNRFLINDKDNDKIFELNDEDNITTVNLNTLFEITKKATEHFLYWLEYGRFSDNHKLAQELSEKAIPFSAKWLNNSMYSIPPSGYSLEDLDQLKNITNIASGFNINQPIYTYTVQEGKVIENKESFFNLNKDEEL